MNEFDLLDAMGCIDDDLLARTEAPPLRVRPLRKFLFIAAAVLLLAMTAAAAPAVRSWIEGPTMTKVQIGRPYKTQEFEGFIEAFARIDLNLENPGVTPSTIRELRVPTCLANGGWSYEKAVRYPDTAFTSYLGIWKKEGKRLTYNQKTITRASDSHPAGYGQFALDLGNNAQVEQQDMTIGGQSYRIFHVSQSHVDAFTRFEAHTDVIWTDGEYAYHITATGMELEELVGIIQSVQSVPMEDYVRDARYDSIEVHYTLPTPDGHSARHTSEDLGYLTRKLWGTESYGISLEQRRIQSPESEISLETLEELLQQLGQSGFFQLGWTLEDVDGTPVYMGCSFESNWAVWERDGCIFILQFYGYTRLNHIKIAEYVRSIVPVTESDAAAAP